VIETAQNPQLYIIRNPAGNLSAEKRIEVVRYLVPVKEIKSKGQAVSG